jgi:hypothetical protein
VVSVNGCCMEHIESCKRNTLYSGNVPIIGKFPSRSYLNFSLNDLMKFWSNYVSGITETRKRITEQR